MPSPPSPLSRSGRGGAAPHSVGNSDCTYVSNDLYHGFDVVCDLAVGKADYSNVEFREEVDPKLIHFLLVCMSNAVEFDPKSCASTIEVKNISRDRMLTSELQTIELTVS